MVWAAFALMTGAVVLAVLWPLGRARAMVARAPDVRFYETQIEEIERDRALGLLTSVDADAAKAEAARRLLRLADEKPAAASSRLASRAAAIVALLAIPAIALPLYFHLGNPDMPDLPLSARLQERESQREMQEAIARIEQHLASNPNDGRGWDLLAPVYMRLGRYEDSARAYANAARLLGETPERLLAQGESLVYIAQEQVTPEALAIFNRVLDLHPGHPVAHFYLALAQEQSGDRAGALVAYSNLSRGTQADAPWQSHVRSRILALGGTPPEPGSAAPPPQAAEALRALPEGEQRAAIRGMVDSLAARLEKDGGDVEGWLRLLRSYYVLQEPELARNALAKAQKALQGDAEALRRIDAMAAELGLKG
jgi:cytochrome c-type biogenesis protein CcmH